MSFSEFDHSAFRRNSFLGLLLCIVICSSGLFHANESQDAKRWLDFMQQGSHAQLIQDLKLLLVVISLLQQWPLEKKQ